MVAFDLLSNHDRDTNVATADRKSTLSPLLQLCQSVCFLLLVLKKNTMISETFTKRGMGAVVGKTANLIMPVKKNRDF